MNVTPQRPGCTADRVVVACTSAARDVVVSARSGAGLPASAEIVALVLDFGDGEPLEALRDATLASGAVRAHVLDVREEFARDYLIPALRAGVLTGDHPRIEPALRSAIASRKLADVARFERATALPPDGIDVPVRRSDRPSSARSAAHAEIGFERGVPASLNGIPMTVVDVIDTVRAIAREHSLGRRDVYVVVQAALARLEAAADPEELPPLRSTLALSYADLVVRGLWESIARAGLDAFFATAQDHVTGTVRVKLENGRWEAVGVSLGGSRVQ